MEGGGEGERKKGWRGGALRSGSGSGSGVGVIGGLGVGASERSPHVIVECTRSANLAKQAQSWDVYIIAHLDATLRYAQPTIAKHLTSLS